MILTNSEPDDQSRHSRLIANATLTHQSTPVPVSDRALGLDSDTIDVQASTIGRCLLMPELRTAASETWRLPGLPRERRERQRIARPDPSHPTALPMVWDKALV
jgi:hypothetical protein